MIRKYLLLLFFSIQFTVIAQKDFLQLGSRYSEDQIYINIAYNQFYNQPEPVGKSGFSYGFSTGFIKDFILNNKNRYSSTIKAKRMFIYYLYNYMEIKHNGMKKYFKNINHATSIHHVNKFKFEVETYSEVKQDFDLFLK